MQQINPIIPAGKNSNSFFFKHKGRVKLCAGSCHIAILPPNGHRNQFSRFGFWLDSLETRQEAGGRTETFTNCTLILPGRPRKWPPPRKPSLMRSSESKKQEVLDSSHQTNSAVSTQELAGSEPMCAETVREVSSNLNLCGDTQWDLNSPCWGPPML